MKNKSYISNNIENYKQTALVFVPNFFRLQKSVIDGFEKNGIGVYLFLDKPSDTIALKSKLRLNPKFVSGDMTKYLKNTVFKFFSSMNRVPDFVVVFEGQAFLSKHAKLLKEFFPNSKKIIYCWDSIERFPYIENNLEYYDETVTFSFDNYKKYNFTRFVPLFIPDDFLLADYKNADNEYDLCFIGTGHPPKIKFLSQLDEYVAEKKLSFYKSVFLPSKTSYFYYKITSSSFRKKTIKDFVFKGKNAEQMQSYYAKSKAIVDAGNPNESGISLRIFECLALQKKVILANKSIKKYNFYHPDRFLVFPEEKDRLLEFLDSPYPLITEDELLELSTQKWIEKILFGTKNN